MLSLPGRFPSLHWDSLPLTLLQELSTGLLVLFHAVPRRGALLEWVESLTLFSYLGWRSPLVLWRGRDLCGLYSALTQDGKLVVEDIPLVMWGLCFGKVGGVISFLIGPVRGYHRMGPQCLLTPPVSASSIYAAVVYVSGG